MRGIQKITFLFSKKTYVLGTHLERHIKACTALNDNIWAANNMSTDCSFLNLNKKIAKSSRKVTILKSASFLQQVKGLRNTQANKSFSFEHIIWLKECYL